MYWPEKYQLGIITHHLRDEGIEYIIEPTLFSIPIDILGARDGEAYAIELKTKDFKRGIEQAERNTSFVDYSYLAVYEERDKENLISRLDNSPAGLFSVGGHVECLSPPNRNTPSKHARASVLDCVTNHVREQSQIQSHG